VDPWYKHAVPRREVREGRSFSPDEFAIALEQVIAGTAPDDYTKPDQFFARTCFTRAQRACRNGAAALIRRNEQYRAGPDADHPVRRRQDAYPSCNRSSTRSGFQPRCESNAGPRATGPPKRPKRDRDGIFDRQDSASGTEGVTTRRVRRGQRRPRRPQEVADLSLAEVTRRVRLPRKREPARRYSSRDGCRLS
jgi:hypothetical protein